MRSASGPARRRAARLADEVGGQAPIQLTPRQLDCLEQLATGLTYAEAAAVLGISVQTVKNHVWAVCVKTNRGSLVGCLWELGWIEIP